MVSKRRPLDIDQCGIEALLNKRGTPTLRAVTEYLQDKVPPKQILMCYETGYELEPVKTALERLGHEVELARGGMAALNRIRGDNHYDLFLSGIAVKGYKRVERQREYVSLVGEACKEKGIPVMIGASLYVLDTDIINISCGFSGMKCYRVSIGDLSPFLADAMSILGYKVKK